MRPAAAPIPQNSVPRTQLMTARGRILGLASPSTFASRLEGFRLGLRDFGCIEGTNIIIEYR
jgi:hypothetical protein